MRMHLRQITAVAATATIGFGVLGMTTAAEAAAKPKTKDITCSAKGDRGTVRLHYTGLRAKIVKIEYKIKLKSGKKTVLNNIKVGDGGTLPPTTSKTDKGIADNRWHILRDKKKAYGRGHGGVGVFFVFDRTGAADPRCNTQKAF